MARITVEDCILKVSNRFELVMMASERGRQLSLGAPLTLSRDNDKNPVVALREIAEESVNVEQLKIDMVSRYRLHKMDDSYSDEDMDRDDQMDQSIEMMDEDDDDLLDGEALDMSASEKGSEQGEDPIV